VVELERGLVEVEIDGRSVHRRGARSGRRGKNGIGLFGHAGNTVVDTFLGGLACGPDRVDVPLQGGVLFGAEVC
jgi:hypothetical protein